MITDFDYCNFILQFKKLEWAKDWKGEEFLMTWSLFSPLPYYSFLEIIDHFYDKDKTTVAWKYGFVNKEITCNILVRYSENKSKLIVINQILKLNLFYILCNFLKFKFDCGFVY